MSKPGLCWVLAGAIGLACSAARGADIDRGAKLYGMHCSACHGAGGRPVLATAPDFTQPTALLRPDPGLLASIRQGRGGMPAYGGVLRDREILDIIAHMRTFHR